MSFRRITRCPDPSAALPDPATAPSAIPAPRRRRQPDVGHSGGETTEESPPPAAPVPEADRPYEVGYGKPPVHSRFSKGRSGNPKGRPGGARGLKKLIRDTLLARVPVRSEGGTKRMTKIEAIIHKQLEQAVKGNQRAAIQLMTLYAAAVPDQPDQGPEGPGALTETDEAIIARFRAEILSNEGDDE